MQISELKKEGLDFHVKVTIPFTDIDDKVHTELINLSKKVKMPGFRAGKVPMDMIIRKYYDSVRVDILQKQTSDSISEIIKNNDLKIANNPKLEDFKSEYDKDVEFILKFELLPKVDLIDFKQISIKKPVLELSKNDVDERLEALVKFNISYVDKESGKAKVGDQLVIDAIGYTDGKEFSGGKLSDYKLILGSKNFIDTFEDQLVGVKSGQEKTVKVTFPDDYFAKELAAKKAEFHVTVKDIYKPSTPELNDEFAIKLGSQSLDELKKDIERGILNEYSEGIMNLMKKELFDQLEGLLKFDVPNSFLEKETMSLKTQFNEDEDVQKKSPSEQAKYYQDLALRRIRIGLLISEYANLNNVKIQQNDLNDALLSITKQFPGREHEIIKLYQNDQNIFSTLKISALENKVVKNILDTEVKITEKTYTKENLDKLLNE